MAGHDPSDTDALRAAAVELQQKLGRKPGNDTPASGRAQEVQAARAIVNAPLDFELKDLDAGHAYLAERGFSRETLRHFGVGYCSRGSLKGRVAIPVHDDEGRLLGYVGRSTSDSGPSDAEPKYRVPGRREVLGVVHELRTGVFLYNGHRHREPVGALVVVTGFSAAWWLTQHGLPNVVATMGCACSEEQAELIVRKTRQDGCVWAMPPGSRDGVRFAEELFKRVGSLRAVRWARLGEGRKPTDVPALTLKETFRI